MFLESIETRALYRLLNARWEDMDQAATIEAVSLSSFILEAQLETLDQNRTLIPRSTQMRLYGDGGIPPPNPATLLAWQSICELATGCKLGTRNDNLPRMYPNDSIYWVVIQLPTLGDGHSETSIQGSLLPSMNLIREEGGYGRWEQHVLELSVDDAGEWSWRHKIYSEPWEDTSVPIASRLSQILREEFGREYGLAAMNRLIGYWRHGLSVKHMVPAAWVALANQRNGSVYTVPFGLHPEKPAHQHMYRIMHDNGIGFRFTDRPLKWIDGWKASVETQFEHLILSGKAGWVPANLLKRVTDKHGALTRVYQNIEGSMVRWSLESNVGLDKFLNNVSAIHDTLGI